MLIYKAMVSVNKQLNKLVTIPFPHLEAGINSLNKAGKLMATAGAKKAMIVTGRSSSAAIIPALCNSLEEHGIDYAIFNQVMPDPTIATVATGADFYKQFHCDSIIALGGGSPIDCAKVIGAKVVRDRPVRTMAGKTQNQKKTTAISCDSNHGRYRLGSHCRRSYFRSGSTAKVRDRRSCIAA